MIRLKRQKSWSEAVRRPSAVGFGLKVVDRSGAKPTFCRQKNFRYSKMTPICEKTKDIVTFEDEKCH